MTISRHRADIGTTCLSYLEAGSGPIAILVHGFPLDARMWLDQLQGLAGDGRRIVAPDLRGHGDSPWAGDPIHSMEMFASDLLALADKLQADAFDLVGFSMGGYAALALAAAAPHRIRTLALVDTKASPDSAEGKAARDAMAESLLREGRGWLHDKLSAATLGAGASPTVRARGRTMIEAQPYESIISDLAGMRDRPDRTALLPSLQMPSAVVVGSEDAITPPAAAREMAGLLPRAELTVIDGVGHMAPLEAPEAVNRALAALWRH